ncbi:MAG TPA: helix-turn-helix domain-containing protein [Stellaceae bacterium]|nr:helix-turn-helix domain-containing protein [Stellaceae bacterium]
MAIGRLDSDERRKAIVEAAVPLFARNGFAGTTTRELAAAAGVSEALLFRHFPSKQSLWREILALGCEGDPALEKLAMLPASTETLVCIVRFMVRRFVLGEEADRRELDLRMRLMLHSILEDGGYARELFAAVAPRVVPLFTASLKAAEKAGDLTSLPADGANRFWFAHHVAAMMAFAFLPQDGFIPYHGSLDQLVEEASDFILRGIGMTEAAIDGSHAMPPSQMAAD